MTKQIPLTTPNGHTAAPRDVDARADRLLNELGKRPVASTAYATAWAARARTADGQAVFPAAAEWLRARQHQDGSWGGSVPCPQDRLVSTLAAVLALAEVRDEWAAVAARSGVEYLRQHALDWRGAVEMIGFELIAPSLLDTAGAAGLVPHLDGADDLARLRSAKLSRVPAGALTRHPTSLLYSLEALDSIVQIKEMTKFCSSNGSMADSPAATVALWNATGAPSALAYLQRARGSTGDGGMPEAYPIDVFEPAWVLYMLWRAGLATPAASPHLARLASLAGSTRNAMAISVDFPVPDSDDTAMVANVLRGFGYPNEPLLEALLSFETDTHFIGFGHERGAAVSANARVLEALSADPDRYRPQMTKATRFLLDARQEGAWWQDKWHLSPYYATAQVAFGLSRVRPRELARTRQWLLDSQHDNGSWGAAGGQPEETAYAVLALNALDTAVHPTAHRPYRRANDYLIEHLDATDGAELWIGKGLYTPPVVVRAAVLAAYAVTLQKGVPRSEDIRSGRRPPDSRPMRTDRGSRSTDPEGSPAMGRRVPDDPAGDADGDDGDRRGGRQPVA